MAGSLAGPPVVALPGRLDRKLRLGPFASGQDAVKFLGFAAVAAALSAATFYVLGGMVLGLGAVVALWKPDDTAIDARMVVLARYATRHLRVGARVSALPVRPSRASDLVRIGPGRWAAVLRTGGVPLAFLPPPELAHRFELFRELLRSIDAEIRLAAGGAPVHAPSVIPPPPAATGSDAIARSGYVQLVDLLCRRRAVRRVYLGVAAAGSREEASGRLDVAATAVAERLAALGVGSERLRGRVLVGASQRLGWKGGRR